MTDEANVPATRRERLSTIEARMASIEERMTKADVQAKQTIGEIETIKAEMARQKREALKAEIEYDWPNLDDRDKVGSLLKLMGVTVYSHQPEQKVIAYISNRHGERDYIETATYEEFIKTQTMVMRLNLESRAGIKPA